MLQRAGCARCAHRSPHPRASFSGAVKEKPAFRRVFFRGWLRLTWRTQQPAPEAAWSTSEVRSPKSFNFAQEALFGTMAYPGAPYSTLSSGTRQLGPASTARPNSVAKAPFTQLLAWVGSDAANRIAMIKKARLVRADRRSDRISLAWSADTHVHSCRWRSLGDGVKFDREWRCHQS